jgi:predicted Zn-dependent protease
MSATNANGETSLAGATETLAAALDALPGANEWQIEARRTEETQLYAIGDRIESRRVVVDEQARVTLHNDHAPRAGEGSSDGPSAALARGSATLTLLPDEIANAGQLAARLAETLTIAGLTDNPVFRLPDPPAAYPAAETVDPALVGDATPEGLLEDAFARVDAEVQRHAGVRVSSAELYITRGERLLRTSRGASCAYPGTTVAFDIVLIASADGNEAEFHAEGTRRRLGDLALERMVAAYVTFAHDSLRATAPATHQGAVVLSGEAASNFFVPMRENLGLASAFTLHTSAQAAFQRLSRLSLGASISGGEPRGDRLTLIADATRPFGTKTAPCDGDGLPATRLAVIEDGVFRNMWADTRYGAYLGMAPTGAFGNVTVLAGETPLDALRASADRAIYEIVAFSAFTPDAVSGDFVSEIKLGYRHDASGTHPIKGGSLSGNVFDALGDARFSRETYADGSYFGPAGLRFASLTIAGE